MRTVEVPRVVFGPLEMALVEMFFPSVFGWAPTDTDFRLGLPARHGGLGIQEVPVLAGEEWASSASLTGVLTEAILRQDKGYVEDLRASRTRRAERLRVRDFGCRLVADEVERELDGRAWRGFHEGRMRGGSAWLSVIPMESLNLDLDGQTFRDAVALRMGVELPDPLPDSCPSCGEPFSLAHALKCKKGGWVVRRHKEVVRAWMSYLRKGGFPNPIEEPEIPPLRGVTGRPATTLEPDARADMLVRGVFREQENAFFDVAVLDTGADFRGRESTAEILVKYEKTKRSRYSDRIAPVGSFTPLVCSVYGTLAPDAARTAHHIARRVD